MNEHLIRKRERLESLLSTIENRSRKFSRARLLAFLLTLFGPYLSFSYNEVLAWILLVFGLLSFLILILLHQRLLAFRTELKFSLEDINRDLAVLSRDWDNISSTQSAQVSPEHLFAYDLNIVGQRSLLQLINISMTNIGGERLAEWLLNPLYEATDIRNRQDEISRIRQHMYRFHRFRWKIKRQLSSKTWDDNGEKLLELLEVGAPKPTLLILSGLTLLGVAAALMFVFQYWMFGFALWSAYLLIYGLLRHSGLEAFWKIESISNELRLWSAVEQAAEIHLKRVSSYSLLQLRMVDSGIGKQALRITAFLGISRSNPIMTFLCNAFLPWDLSGEYWTANLIARLKPVARKWQQRFSELEALISLAHFADLHPHYVSAEVQEHSGGSFATTSMLHPLLRPADSIPNDFRDDFLGDVYLITGSNMSGKSTFLRTIGVNMLLAQIGAPVAADTFAFRPVRLATSMGVQDSLADGISLFYAEVRRLKLILQHLEEPNEIPMLLLIDEVFRGTNNRERFIGSQSLLLELLNKNASTFVTTHDLELTQLAEAQKGLHNYHFRETITGGKMDFSYKLHEGPCPTTNALAIMKLAGLPVYDEKD